jgi:hypothetical protein
MQWEKTITRLPSSSPKIPRRLIFVDTRYNIIDQKEPKHLYNNIQKTISAYIKAWNQAPEEAEVLFCTEAECKHMIQRVEPRLVLPYEVEHLEIQVLRV